jgi:ribosomal protein S18 acetylase RimI-like enzyme
MGLVLSRYPFTPDDWDEVQSFECGGKEHQREVSDWLKGRVEEDSALAALADDPPARIWLYRLEEEDPEDGHGELVGFGALNNSAWRWTTKKSPYVPITVLLWYAVQSQFKRQPPGDEDGYYSSQILDDLIDQALSDKQDRPILGLCVRPENVRAIDLYRRKHFTVELDPFTDKTTGIKYTRMARILDPMRVNELLRVTQKKS